MLHPEDADALHRYSVLVFSPNQSGGELKVRFEATQKMLSLWLFKCHQDHDSFIYSLSILNLAVVKVHKEASPSELSMFLSRISRNFA